MSNWAKLNIDKSYQNELSVIETTTDYEKVASIGNGKIFTIDNNDPWIAPVKCFWEECPDYVSAGWFKIMDVYCSDDEAAFWYLNRKPKNLPPRTHEELELEKIKNIPRKGKIAAVRIQSLENFTVQTFVLDINNRRVGEMRKLIANALGNKDESIDTLACTNLWTPDEIVARYKKRNSGVNFETVNILQSVLDGQRHGQNPSVGVSGNQRQLLIDDDMRVTDMIGKILVFSQRTIPKSPQSLDVVDIILDIIL